jgi:hypothetical protein
MLSISASGANSTTAALYSPIRSGGDAQRSTLSDQQQQQQAKLQEISKLSETDRHVRSHEQAHLAAAGPYAGGGPSYTYQKGPDGNEYAVGGEVPIDVSPIPGDPQKTIEKERVVQAAANAPSDPSPQDRAVAAEAASLQATAEAKLDQQKSENPNGAYGEQRPDTGLLFTITA